METLASNCIGSPIAATSLSLLLRTIVASYNYSGCGQAPKFGDFEAHRHWMEVTNNLPAQMWYTNVSQVNDLSYWGIDYPPLMAYHNFLFGKLARVMGRSSWIEPVVSRGFESPPLKLFMRVSVMLTDMVFYFPACMLLTVVMDKRPPGHQLFYRYLVWNPLLILIDHGHFQYNSMCIGLALAGVAAIADSSKWMPIGTVLFTLALLTKQMAFYYFPPLFAYIIIASLIRPWYDGQPRLMKSLMTLVKMAVAAIVTAGVVCMPYIRSRETFQSLLSRLIPVDRGLFEDKVANCWCFINIFYKLRDRHSPEQLLVLSAILTTAGLLLSLIKVKRENLLLCIFNSSLAFFLYSFQVHEKTILFPAVIASYLLSQLDYSAFTWFLSVSYLSLAHLSRKNGHWFIFYPLLAFYLVVSSIRPWTLPAAAQHHTLQIHLVESRLGYRYLGLTYGRLRMLGWLSLAVCSLLSVCVMFLRSPIPRLPDLWVVLLYSYCFACFALFHVLCTWFLWSDRRVGSKKSD